MTGDFEIRPLKTREEYRACVALQYETWGGGFSEAVPATLLRLTQKLGGVAAGAFDEDGRLGGFVFGLTGYDAGRPIHWSDMLAVRADLRGRGLGVRLKLYQRRILLDAGIETARWTFDPLESGNAHLNLARLGAVCGEYVADMYGDSDSPLHRGLDTDRLVATWEMAGEHVRCRVEMGGPPPGPADVAGLPLINETRGGSPFPESGEPALGLDSPRLRLAIPVDIQSLKREAPELASDWRGKTRAAFEAYFARGYVAHEMVREGERSCYVLTRNDLLR